MILQNDGAYDLVARTEQNPAPLGRYFTRREGRRSCLWGGQRGSHPHVSRVGRAGDRGQSRPRVRWSPHKPRAVGQLCRGLGGWLAGPVWVSGCRGRHRHGSSATATRITPTGFLSGKLFQSLISLTVRKFHLFKVSAKPCLQLLNLMPLFARLEINFPLSIFHM